MVIWEVNNSRNNNKISNSNKACYNNNNFNLQPYTHQHSKTNYAKQSDKRYYSNKLTISNKDYQNYKLS